MLDIPYKTGQHDFVAPRLAMAKDHCVKQKGEIRLKAEL